MPATGRIAEFTAPHQPFVLREMPVPDPGPGAALVRVTMSNICGSDLHAWHGKFVTTGLGGELPTVLGHEMIGRIAKLGAGVTMDANGSPLKEGDRVTFSYFVPCGACRNCVRGHRVACLQLKMAMLGNCSRWPHFVGGYADYFYLHPNTVIYKVPAGLPDEVVAGANCALSQVVYGLDRARLTFDESIVIQGAGGLGLYCAAVAKARGARMVVVIDRVPERLAMAKAFGADAVINLDDFPDSKALHKEVRRLTDGYGADVVAELVGSPVVVNDGIKFLASMGRYLEMGNINFGMTYESDPSRLVMANKSIIGVSLYEPYALGESLRFLERSKHTLPLDKMLAARFPLADINAAFEKADKREVVRACITME